MVNFDRLDQEFCLVTLFSGGFDRLRFHIVFQDPKRMDLRMERPGEMSVNDPVPEFLRQESKISIRISDPPAGYRTATLSDVLASRGFEHFKPVLAFKLDVDRLCAFFYSRRLRCANDRKDVCRMAQQPGQ